MSKSKFYDEIRTAKEEREVEDVYNKGISLYFKDCPILHPFKCDGLIDTRSNKGKLLKLIIEYKFDDDMKSRYVRAKVLTQVLFYIKQFELHGEILPTVVMVGDINECFALHTNCLIPYLDEDNIDWSKAPSKAHDLYPELVTKISDDNEINPFVYWIDDKFSFKDVVDKIHELADNVQRFVHITEHNISNIFGYFCDRVIKNKDKIHPNELVSVFIGLITNDCNYYKHPVKANTVVTPTGEYYVDSRTFDAFFKFFARDYTPKEKRCFSEISDRLIEDVKRRRNGEFFTPTLFVDYAHRMIESVLGDDWRDKYVVWDNCWGTGNLTRDYKFRELYASTLEPSELEIGRKYNPEAHKFIFDFLNTDLCGDLFNQIKPVPKELIQNLKDKKPIIFFLNPPYATSSSNFGQGVASKGKKACSSVIYDKMVEHKMGNACKNLYAQFLYRICLIKQEFNLNECFVCLFSPTLFLTGPAWKEFRKVWLNEFEFVQACQFKASHFADVSDSWGISFSIWKSGVTKNKSEFDCFLIDKDSDEQEIIIKGQKLLYNLDSNSKPLKLWIKEPIKGVSVFDMPTLSNGITVKTGVNCKTKIAKDALGCYYNMGNNCDQNQQKVALFSSSDSSNANGLSILPNNFERICCAFSARRLISKNWINWSDEYLMPNTNCDQYETFCKDSLIFSIFESKSNQSSLRHIEYKGKFWDIKNEFFWMSKDEIMELAEKYSNDFCYNDAYSSDERYVYTLLCDGLYGRLSNEAKAVLDKATDLVRKSFAYRMDFDEDHPDYQINTWDAGFYQLKALWNERLKQEFAEFKELYKKLSDKMRPMVYELGFLK